MKRLSILLLILCLLAGCATQGSTSAPSTQPSTNQAEKPTENTTPSTVPPTSSTQASTESTAPETTEPAPITFTLYYPDDQLMDMLKAEITINTLDPMAIIQHLKDYGVLKEGVSVNFAEMEGTQLNLDLNEAFLMQIYSCGTTSEGMLMGSLVNTFCSAYDAESIMITADGEIIHSGHVDYDYPMSPYFTDEQ